MGEAQSATIDQPDLRSASIRTATIDLLFVLTTLITTKAVLLQIAAFWTYAGPISLVASLFVAHWRLQRSGESWRDLGLQRPQRLGRAVMWAVALLIVTIASGIAIETLIPAITGDNLNVIDPRYAERFADVPGNLYLYIYWMLVAWVVGAFTEEMLFRAMLISRFERLFAHFRYPVLIAVVLQAVLFGQQHLYYQGLNGALATGGIALISGGGYLLLRRSLWPLILSHGLANSIGLTLIYAGMQPAG